MRTAERMLRRPGLKLTILLLVLASGTLEVELSAALGAHGISPGELAKLRRLAVVDPWKASNNEGQALISRIGSERATTGSGNKIVTFQGKTHVVWQDSVDRLYYSQIRTLDRSTGQWSPTHTITKADWNHTRPNITIDSKGYLHVVTREHYIRSVRPNDASEWTEPVECYGKYECYPYVVCGPQDGLYLTTGQNRGGVGGDFFTIRSGAKWQYQAMLVRRQKRYQGYGAYHNSLSWGPDQKALHMCSAFFMGFAGEDRMLQGLHQAVGYMRSGDFGKTWTKADGTPIVLPATTESIDLIDEGIRDADATEKPKPGIRTCGIAVDSQNRPYVVYVRHTPDPMQSHLVVADESGTWQRRPLHQAIEKNWPGWGAFRCSVSITPQDVICLALWLAPREHPEANWDPGEWGQPAFWLRKFPKIQRIGWLESEDGGRTFRTRSLVEHDPKIGALQPTMEKPTGFNQVPWRPGFVYFVGHDRYTEGGETLDNLVYYVDQQKAGR